MAECKLYAVASIIAKGHIASSRSLAVAEVTQLVAAWLQLHTESQGQKHARKTDLGDMQTSHNRHIRLDKCADACTLPQAGSSDISLG